MSQVYIHAAKFAVKLTFTTFRENVQAHAPMGLFYKLIWYLVKNVALLVQLVLEQEATVQNVITNFGIIIIVSTSVQKIFLLIKAIHVETVKVT